jgi:hypothetical protein
MFMGQKSSIWNNARCVEHLSKDDLLLPRNILLKLQTTKPIMSSFLLQE